MQQGNSSLGKLMIGGIWVGYAALLILALASPNAVDAEHARQTWALLGLAFLGCAFGTGFLRLLRV